MDCEVDPVIIVQDAEDGSFRRRGTFDRVSLEEAFYGHSIPPDGVV
jgi:hypothetical protein